MTWEKMKIKYPEYRENMSEEREKEFVNDCFICYENEEFSKKFWSPFGDYKNREGEEFEVIGRCTIENCDLRVLPMWNIRFKDGTIIAAYPEEIILREMRDNGYTLESIV